MNRKILGGLLVASMCISISAARAQTCAAYPYALANSTTADAGPVMGNFEAIRTCANTLLAPLYNPNFTGKVGIATTTPATPLDVNGAVTVENGGIVNLWASGGTLEGQVYGIASGTGAGGLAFTTGGAWGGEYRFYQRPSGVSSTGLRIHVNQVDGNYLSIYNTTPTEMVRINASGTSWLTGGSVGVGTTAPTYTFMVNGTAGGTSAWQVSSDERLKKNIVPIEGAMAIVEQLRGVRFDWRTPGERSVGKDLNLPVSDPQVGFIAQEVKKVLPEAVSVAANADGTMSVQETKIIPVLVEAVKELNRANTALKSANRQNAEQIALLQKQLDQLRNRMDRRSADREQNRQATRSKT